MSIRLPSGERVIRAFRADAELEEVYAFVECYDFLRPDEAEEALAEKEALLEEPEDFEHTYGFRLVSPMPRVVYGLDEGGSIGDRIGKGGNLLWS